MSTTRKKAKKNEFFEGLRDAMAEGLDALQKGKVLTTRDVEAVPAPKPMTAKQIAALRRRKLHLSQAVFAEVTNSSVKTIHAWEQGRTQPSGCALRFLRLLESHPELLLELLGKGSQEAGEGGSSSGSCRDGRVVASPSTSGARALNFA